MVIFYLQLWKGVHAKTKQLTHDEIRKKLIESLVMNDNQETRKVKEVEDPENAVEVIHECKRIIRTKISSRQGF